LLTDDADDDVRVCFSGSRRTAVVGGHLRARNARGCRRSADVHVERRKSCAVVDLVPQRVSAVRRLVHGHAADGQVRRHRVHPDVVADRR